MKQLFLNSQLYYITTKGKCKCNSNDEGGAKVEAEANALGAGKATYIHCDISKQENVKEFFAKAMEILGGLDVLANIAGVERNKPATDFVDDDLAFVMGVNLNGTIWTNRKHIKFSVITKLKVLSSTLLPILLFPVCPTAQFMQLPKAQ